MPSLIPPILYDPDYDVRRVFANGLIRLVENAELHLVQGDKTVKAWLYGRSLHDWKSALNAIAAAIEARRATRPEYPTAEELFGWVIYHRWMVDGARNLPGFRVVKSLSGVQASAQRDYLDTVRSCKLPLTKSEMADFELVCRLIIKHADVPATLIERPEHVLQYA